MILVDLVLLMVLQNQLLLFENKRVEKRLRQLQANIEDNLIDSEYKSEILSDELDKLLKSFFVKDGEGCAAILLKNSLISSGSCQYAYIFKQNIFQATRSDKIEQTLIGKEWAVFQYGAQFASIAMPLKINGEDIGGIGIMYSLAPLYSLFRRSQELFFFYLMVNSLLLPIGGYLIISRIFMRPIKRLVARAEQYDAAIYDKDADMLFSVRLEDGELNKLSLALNQMMNRISKDRETLQENVAALKEANFELKQAQTEVIRAEKLASVGRLSAGIAHEIGNPIGIILGYLELLRSDVSVSEEQLEYLSRAEAEILRVNAIIRQLLNLSRPIEGEPVMFSIHSFLEELIESLKVQPLLAELHITMETDAERDDVLADPDHFRQVCLNILINAADAIKSSSNADEGAIGIKTTTTEKNGPSMIEIWISDNGSGIAESNLGNIFDPFFTTKEPGEGTGLGLSVSLTIIEQMGGTLAAQPNAGGNGTSVIISLPLVDRQL